MGGALLVDGGSDINFEIWEVLFRDMGGAFSRCGRCCLEIWEVLFRDMGGAVSRYGRCFIEIWEVP